jgi:hypothetical protein
MPAHGANTGSDLLTQRPDHPCTDPGRRVASVQSASIIGNGERRPSVPFAEADQDAPILSWGEGVLDRVCDQFIENEAYRDSLIDVKREGLYSSSRTILILLSARTDC